MTQSVAIIDYGSGNLRSAAKAFERAGAETGQAIQVHVTGDADRVANADRILLPGVGAFADCMAGLTGLDGMAEALEQSVRRQGRPFLGICVGMQLMATRGLEHGEHRGLGWIEGDVTLIEPLDRGLKIPHMGWNELQILEPHPVLAGINDGDHAYFVHSYGVRAAKADIVKSEVDYGGPVTAIVGCDNMVGTQFHPEKSQATGLRLIANFLAWRP
ncbi:MAG: imidazole glycerol phosphate synthase subunit HisH [Minwuiales bacterium]|nr:imidazole glycerol phosphate synthase subunit HisH [Minwuiales bacterium]